MPWLDFRLFRDPHVLGGTAGWRVFCIHPVLLGLVLLMCGDAPRTSAAKRAFSREALMIAIILSALVHNVLIPMLDVFQPSLALVLYIGVFAGFILITVSVGTHWRT